MDLCSRRLAGDQQSRGRRDLKDRPWTKRKFVGAKAAISNFLDKRLELVVGHADGQTSEEPKAVAMNMAGIMPNAVAIANERFPMGVSAYPAETRK